MRTIQKFLNLRSSNNRLDELRTSQRNSRSMQQQIVEMMKENESFVRHSPIIKEPGLESESESEKEEDEEQNQQPSYKIPMPITVTQEWLENARAAIRNGCSVGCSYSSPQLGNVEQESHTLDSEVASLVQDLTSTVLEVCRSTKGKAGMVQCEPCRILMTAKGVIVIIKYKNMEKRQEEVSNYIKSYLESANLLDTKGEPLLSDRVPKSTVAIRWEGANGESFLKRVRFLKTFKCFDYFLDFETGETNSTWDRSTNNVLNNLITRQTIKPDYIGREFTMDALKPHILDRSQSATRTPKRHHIRRIKSEDNEPVDITCIDKDDGTIDKLQVF